MKDLVIQIVKFSRLADLTNNEVAVVLDVLNHAYQIDCALEVCSKPVKEWLREFLYLNPKQLKDVWADMYYLYIFRYEIEKMCETMNLNEAIKFVKTEFIK